jgi:imidazolonepropionase-like amidohydrolase
MGSRMMTALVAASLAMGAAGAEAQQIQLQTEARPAPRGSLVIQNLDELWTATGQVHRNVSIAVRDGRITAIGATVATPAGAQIIDGRGLTAIPGIVDEHSHIAMGGGSNEGTAPIVPEVRVIDALNGQDFGIYQALSGGVTTAQILHGSANPIGGQSAVIKTRWGVNDAFQLLVEGAPRMVKFALGENVTQKNRSTPTDRFPASRAGVEAVYDQAFTAAQEYRAAWAAHRRNPRAQPAPRRDLRLEALVDIMEGRIRVHAHSYRSDEILMLMRVAERYGFRIDAFTHVLEGYRVADELARHGAAASTFSDWWMYKLEAFEATPWNAAIMHNRGVLTTLNSDIPWLQSSMLYEMQKPVKYGGVSKEDALRMMTINGAKQLRIDHLVGSLEVGKHGDIVLLNGDPFNTFTRVEKTIVDGIIYYDRLDEAARRGEPVRAIAGVEGPAPTPAQRPGAIETPLNTEVPSVAAAHKLTDPIDRSAVVAITGATVHPVSRALIPNGVVLIREGRIAAVGTAAEVQVPQNARRVDASGRHVYPGMIDPLTAVGIIDIESISSARDDREVGTFNPHMRALFSINPYSEGIFVGRANGVTSVLTVPTSGIVRGTASVVALKGDTPEQMAVDARNALVVAFPSPRGEIWEEAKLEGDNIVRLMDLFRRAELYAARPSALRDPTAPWEVNSEPSDRVLLDAMVPAVTGAVPTIFIAQRERDLKTLLMFLDSFPRVRAAVGGGAQAYHVAAELAKRGIPVIVGSTFEPTISRDDPVTAAWRNAEILRQAGVKVAFTTSFSPEGASELRNLPYAAAKAVAYGMPRDEAYRAITLNAAEILGLGDRMGSLDVGKRADLIITNEDPLQILANVERMWIGGEEVPLVSKHSRLYEQFRGRVAAPVAEENGGR